MSLEDYYNQAKQSHTVLREKICRRLSISRETFYGRLRNGSWTTLEKEAIADLLEMDVQTLFPEIQPTP